MSHDDHGCHSCRQEKPYPIVTEESIPSRFDNLVYALYGEITKQVVAGRVVWNIACDPNLTAQITDLPRLPGEGLLCYLIRCSDFYANSFNGMVTLTGTQTLTNKTLVNPLGITPADVGADVAGSAAAAEAAAIAASDPSGSAATAQSNAQAFATAAANAAQAAAIAASEAFSSNASNLSSGSIPRTIPTVGVNDGSNAATGNVGEYLTNTVAVGAAVSLTSGVTSPIASLNLSAGDWDVWGVVDFHPDTTTSITGTQVGALHSNSFTGQDTSAIDFFAAVVPNADFNKLTPRYRITINSNPVVNLLAKAYFSVSTLSAYGTIFARRVR